MRAQFAFKMFMIRARSFLHKAQNHQRGGGSQKRHAPVGLIVLVLHGMGVWAWWTSGTQSRATRQAEAITRVTLTLPAPERPAVTKSTPGKRSQAPSSILAHQRAPSSAQAVALPTDPAPTVAPAEPSAHADPLNLTLSRNDLAAILAPKTPGTPQLPQRLPKTVETLIADAFGESGPWTEERVDIDHIRLRRGNTCIMLERPATARLFPMDDAANRVPWKANTYRCG